MSWFPSAFPHEPNISDPGMTLRDYFAGQALVGCLNNIELLEGMLTRLKTNTGLGPFIGGMAYAYADAMMEARKT